jgi:hypothetical protein
MRHEFREDEGQEPAALLQEHAGSQPRSMDPMHSLALYDEPMKSCSPLGDCSVPALTAVQDRISRRLPQRSAIERASDVELLAITDELSTELALLDGDLRANDFSLSDEPTLRNGIAYIEFQLGEVVKQTERRLRARHPQPLHGTDQTDDFRHRFDAMRRADIVDAVQTLGVPLSKRGREWWGLCPFHQERTPSFAVNPAKGVWRCHGCQRGGDLVRFVTERHHLNAVEALRFLE